MPTPLESLLLNFQAPRPQVAQEQAQGPSYEGLLSYLASATPPAAPGRSGGRGGGTGGPMWNRFGGEMENLYTGVPGHEGSHLHVATEKGPLRRLLRKVENKGFAIGEHPAYGGVDPVHTEDSWHYKNRAADVNYYGGGRWENEDQALTWLEHWLQRHGIVTN